MCSVLLPFDGNKYVTIQEKQFLVLKALLNMIVHVIILIFSLLEIHGLTSSILLKHLQWHGSRGKS